MKFRFSVQRLLLATTLIAMAGGCWWWVKYLVAAQIGHDHLVAGLVFAIPSLLLGAALCFATSIRTGVVAATVSFFGFVCLAFIANLVVPMLK